MFGKKKKQEINSIIEAAVAETAPADKSDKPAEPDKASESDKPAELDKATESDKPAEPDKASESDKPAETKDKSDKPISIKKNRKKKKKSKKAVLKYVIVGIFVILLAVGAALFGRTFLLKPQLELAQSYMDAEQWDEAEDAYNKALRIFPNSADAYLGLAEVSIGRGELTEAINILEKGVEVTHSSNLEKSREVIMDQVFATYVLDSYLVNILPKETAKLTMEHRSEDMNFSVKWSSADESIGTVDQDGNITAIKNGTTKIIATIGNDTWGYRDVSATLIVGVIVTYLEEQGCDYLTSSSGIMVPCFVYQQTNDGFRKYDGTLEIEQGKATYSLTKCKISDPDPEGYVTYDIEYKINVPTKFGILAGSKEAKHAWYYNWIAEDMMLCDDLTGRIFSVQDLYGEEGLIYDSTVEWNDMEYHITGTIESEWENKEEWAITYSPLTTITWAEAPAIGTYKLKVRVPAEYQGLCLALDKRGVTDYKDPEYDEEGYEYDSAETFTDTFFFDPREDGSVPGPQDYYVLKLVNFAK